MDKNVLIKIIIMVVALGIVGYFGMDMLGGSGGATTTSGGTVVQEKVVDVPAKVNLQQAKDSAFDRAAQDPQGRHGAAMVPKPGAPQLQSYPATIQHSGEAQRYANKFYKTQNELRYLKLESEVQKLTQQMSDTRVKQIEAEIKYKQAQSALNTIQSLGGGGMAGAGMPQMAQRQRAEQAPPPPTPAQIQAQMMKERDAVSAEAQKLFRLKYTVYSAYRWSASIEKLATTEEIRVVPGSYLVGGWKVDAIRSEAVVLDKNGIKVTMTMAPIVSHMTPRIVKKSRGDGENSQGSGQQGAPQAVRQGTPQQRLPF